MNHANFYNDYEKLLDFISLSKDEFMSSYSYLTDDEYENTSKMVLANGGGESYKISAHILNMIRNQGEMVFRMSISHLLDTGMRFLTLENCEATCDEIRKTDDTKHFITNEIKIKVVETATNIARINHLHILVYISNNVEYDVGQKEIGYDRLKQITENLMEWVVCDSDNSADDYDTFSNHVRIDDDEMKQLGFGYLVDMHDKTHRRKEDD